MTNGTECRHVRPQLTRLVDGELSPREIERLEDHLESCTACARERQALGALQAAYRGLPAAPASAADRAAIVRAARARGAPNSPPHRWGLFRNPVPEVVTACALAASLMLALSLQSAARRARAPVLTPASGSVLTLVEYRAKMEGRAIDAHARFSSGPPQ